MTTSFTVWALFLVITAGAFALDLAVNRHAISFRRAIARSVAWIALGLAFAGVVLVGLGTEAAEEYLSAFLIEKALSLDNLTAFLLIFRELGIPARVQHRGLAAGIAGAVVTRGAFIIAGVEMLRRWNPIVNVLAVVLALAAVRTLKNAEPNPGNSRLLAFARRHLRIVDPGEKQRFFVRIGDRWFATTLVVAVVAIEMTDVVFAVDSIPSALAVTNRPFVLYSSNVLAVLGLRALYVVLATGISRLPFLRYGVAVLLLLAATKLIASNWIAVPAPVTAAIVLGCVTVLIVLAVAFKRRERAR